MRSAAALVLAAAAPGAAAQLLIAKSVVPLTAGPGQPVEFTVLVENSGAEPALAVEVTESLPSGLSPVPGMAAFVSQGSYDPGAGTWSLGDLDGGVTATLVLPAVVDGPDPPPCLVNVAVLEASADDPTRDRASAAAAVRQDGVSGCADLDVRNVIFEVPQPFCADDTNVRIDFSVANAGPDPARGVVVTVSPSSSPLSGLRFTSPACAGSNPLRCELADLAPGGIRLLALESDRFNNPSEYSVTFTIAVSTTDTDYEGGNDARVLTRTVPRTVVPDCPIPNPLGGGASGCFIATAAWGQPDHRDVMTLRRFRDRVLLPTAPGRALVDAYYRRSPAAARFIVDKPVLRGAVRASLAPLVFTINHPVVVLLALLGALALLRRRRGDAGRR